MNTCVSSMTTYREDLDEIVELIVETVCAKAKDHPYCRKRFSA